MQDKSQYVAVYGLIYNSDRQILIVQRAKNDTLPGVWELPGGVLDFGEDPNAAVKREIKEETGLIISPAQVITIGSYFKHQTTHVLRIAYYCHLDNPNQEVRLSADHSDFAWIDPNELKNMPLSDFLLKVVEEVRK